MIRGRRYVYGIPVSSPPVLAPTTMQSSAEQYGITWTFDQEYPVGQFVNGDYFVVGPITVVSVDPSPSQGRNGSMIDPPKGFQAYDGRAGSNYDAANAVSYPVTINGTSSLVSSISDPSPPTDQYLDTAAVLTVVSEADFASMTNGPYFRPGIIGTTKVFYSAADINWGLLAAAELVATSMVPRVSDTYSTPGSSGTTYDWARHFERPWILHGSGWQYRMIMPRNNSPGYHQYVARLLSHAAVMVVSDVEDKNEFVHNYIQVGLDYHNMLTNSGTGAYNYFFPTVFAGLILGNNSMRDLYKDGNNIGTEYHSVNNRVYFGLQRTSGSALLPSFSRTDVVMGGATSYGESEPDTYTSYFERFGRRPVRFTLNRADNNNDGHEELHPNEWVTPTIDNENYPGYRRMHSISMVGFTLAAIALGLDTEHTGNEAYFDYALRWMSEGDDIMHDSYAPDGTVHGYSTSGSGFVNEMWNSHEALIINKVEGV